MQGTADSVYRDFVKVRFCQRDATLRSVPGITSFLVYLADKLGMTLLAVTVVPVYGDEPHLKDEGGVTGVAVIAESHIAVHTWPENSAVNIDVYSCKEYDSGALLLECESYFAGKREV